MADDINQVFQPKELLLLLNLDITRINVEYGLGASIDYKFDFRASEFLKFAELDLQQGSDHGLVNALSNAKRAIDCQVDTVLGSVGLLSHRNFQQKMDDLAELGVVSPRIVRKVVRSRNYLEHEFKKPELSQVEDAVDIAGLFVFSLEQVLNVFTTEFVFKTNVEGVVDGDYPYADKWLDVMFSGKDKHFDLVGHVFDEIPTAETRISHRIRLAQILPHDKGFKELIRLCLSLAKTVEEEELRLQAINFIQLFVTNQ